MSDKVTYTVGGTVQASGGIYISRDADEELLRLCQAGEFCYVLTARQMGKSSLMVATMERLAEEGIRSVEIDLTEMGTELSGLTAEQWYLGLVDLIVDQLDLDVDYMAWWDERAHLGPTQRLSQFLRQVVLEQVSEPVVIFIDEIDSTLNLDFTDDFFAAIRACYNARASDPAFKRLSFVLLGMATPGDLISDPQRTPFNIGRQMDLTDFTERQAIPLAAGLGLPPVEAGQVLTWILDWTGGHPYLTQRLCAATAASPTKSWDTAAVNKLVEKTFLGEQSAQDSNLRFVRDMLTQRAPDKAAVLKTYRRIHAGKAVSDEERSPVKTHLKLSGIVKRKGDNLAIRNEIYRRVFDLAWVRENTAVNWARIVAVIAVFVALLAIGSIVYDAWRVRIQSQDCIANFYQASAPEKRVAHLAKIFRLQGLVLPTDYDYQARELFYGLSREEQLALFNVNNLVEDSDLIVLIQGLYITLADTDGTDSTRPLLEAMVRALDYLNETKETNDLRNEINSWLQGRELARQNQYADALAEYTKAIALNGENPATLYERARVQIELSEYRQALSDLDQVMAIARRAPAPTPTALSVLTPTSTSTPRADMTPTETPTPATPISTSLPISTEMPIPTATPTPAAMISDFATIGQMISAVRNIIYGNPDLVSSLASAQDSEYLNLREFGLIPTLTPTPIPPGEMPSDLTLTLAAFPAATVTPIATPIPMPPPGEHYNIVKYEGISYCGYTEFRFNVKDSSGAGKRDVTIHIWTDWGFDASVTTDSMGDAAKRIEDDFFDSVWHIELIENGQAVDQLDVVTTSGCKEPDKADSSDYSVWTIHWQEKTPTSTVIPIATPTRTAMPTPELLPPPILLEPENGASFMGEPVIFRWQWDRPLAQDESFSLRVHKEGETEICHHASVHALEYTGGLSYCSEGTLYWSVALVRELCKDCPEEGRWQLASEPSVERWIYYTPGEEPWPTVPTKSPYQYHIGRIGCSPNCGTTGAKGTVYTDKAGSGRVDGVYVKVWADGWEGAWSKQTYNGFWEVLFGPGPRGGKWYAAVYSHDKSEQLSEIVEFHTDFEPCAPGSGGCQWAEIDFVGNW